MMGDHLESRRFPRSARYHPDWVVAGVSGGANPLWLTEWLTEEMELRPGMRVLDLGCGRGASSVFLQQEFDVQVWAVDLWFGVDERLERIRDAGAQDAIFPLHADARALPFAAGFFDAVVSIDSFVYYGTDDLYLNYLARFVRPGGPIGIVGAGLVAEFDGPVPDHLATWWEPSMACLHSADWWRRHWERSAVAQVDLADTLPDGWRLWLDWQHAVAPDNSVEIDALTADQGRHLGYVRAIARRHTDRTPDEPITSIPVDYSRQPLYRAAEPSG
ncbi:cyclopropane-fatty-acyl-phospholipid synthase family protein [Parafrankia sp. FMc2]|uniref:cyclopropane-fatty-acyl-phospholipid synthase family protein n=1 Tax=Parafrankia sp. FMc2 TaxID=3233196 RepID=UPI0034D4A2E7